MVPLTVSLFFAYFLICDCILNNCLFFGGVEAFGQSSTSSPFGSQSVFGQNNNANNNPFAPKPFGSTSPFGAQTGSSIFGSNSTGVFGATQASSPLGSTTAFGASSTPAFGASSTPAFGASSANAFGGLLIYRLFFQISFVLLTLCVT